MNKRVILFAHYGDTTFLSPALKAARISNPASSIVLLGDQEKSPVAGIKLENISQFSEAAAAFAKVYQHLSSNPYEYELFCFKRWFLALDYMRSRGVQRAALFDSDVLLYSDLESATVPFEDYELSLSFDASGTVSGHSAIINSVPGLEDFCAFLLSLYADSESVAPMRAHFEDCQAKGIQGGACDMTALTLYAKQHKVGNTARVIDNAFFDHNINLAQGMELSARGMKQIVFRKNLPYCRTLDSGSLVRCHSLHFQGGAKSHMNAHSPNPLTRALYKFRDLIRRIRP